jgi:hypothetical protein
MDVPWANDIAVRGVGFELVIRNFLKRSGSFPVDATLTPASLEGLSATYRALGSAGGVLAQVRGEPMGRS